MLPVLLRPYPAAWLFPCRPTREQVLVCNVHRPLRRVVPARPSLLRLQPPSVVT
ncbi:hypothetical protein H4W32_001652 [Actinophytocola algeriensis]|uniref:Uncharacterized protein n=1 Tax=Actinophytocola algeriensis TaxID=1768010 RepID=A0A7W7QFL4_9PSEU|nr:hypothetical protein [Actinophytocola algeriensis]MBE1473610.1 hypothetical protein [Actinophytocola algeriensis]